MAELIRRANSRVNSPFPAVLSRVGLSRAGTASGGTPTRSTAYTPYLKMSRSALSRIAPLHPNRHTPPPPPPRPPPKPKTKKEREQEEAWEEELIESVGGVSEWACMTDAERAEARRAKRERETVGWEE
ncbi:hypothetical protein FISHEDRAFT_68295 [Fistulina hepatica ATCC 64428]|uniref:Uncharacterized protein n=1 Tax=Fistulina hepatica ATCC 64428 TaxID=1128425 RepID=A0A0D6ZZ82_9AGAR|nr:hypothetical protein FISHEDRAFT_68295 [Fistulina hepatica ATCC 64428]